MNWHYGSPNGGLEPQTPKARYTMLVDIRPCSARGCHGGRKSLATQPGPEKSGARRRKCTSEPATSRTRKAGRGSCQESPRFPQIDSQAGQRPEGMVTPPRLSQ